MAYSSRMWRQAADSRVPCEVRRICGGAAAAHARRQRDTAALNRRLRMWSRRRFLEIVSGLPLVGIGRSAEASRSFLPAGAPVVAAGARGFSRAAPASAARDYFRELG